MSPVHTLQTFYQLTGNGAPPTGDAAGHFNILPLSDLLLPTHKPRNLARRSYFKVSLVTGHSRMHFANETIVAAGTVLTFTSPLHPYSWELITPAQSGYVCVFTEDFLQRQLDLRNLVTFAAIPHSCLQLTDAQVPFFTTLFERIRDNHQSDYPFRHALVRCLLMELIFEAQKLLPAALAAPVNAGSAYERIASRFFDLLQQQYTYTGNPPTRSPQYFATQLNVHVNHLNKVLRAVTGQTTSGWIHQKMLEEAMLLLKNHAVNINEIAWALGFEAPNHFSTFFKRHTDKTPQQYREQQND